MAELEIDINMRIREWDVIQVKLTTSLFLSLLACQQAFQLRESREVTRQRHAKGDAPQASLLARAFSRRLHKTTLIWFTEMLSCQNINILLTDRFYHISPIAGSGQKVNSLVRSRLYRIKKSRKQVKRKISSALSC